MTTDHDIDDAMGTSGADEALTTFARHIGAVRSRPAPEGPAVLTPPISLPRDHAEGPEWAPSLVVFGSYGTPASRPLGDLLQQLREAHPASFRVAWRHLPEAEEHPRAVGLALAAEAAAAQSRFWSMNRELLAMRHGDLEDLHAAARRADVDFYRLLDRMRTGVGADRIVADVESARASAVGSAPALFVNGERFSGDLHPATVWAALQAPGHGRAARRARRRGSGRPGDRLAAMGPVLLCYDGSDDADRAVRCAATLLRPQDAVVLDLARRPFQADVAESGRRVALDAGFDPVAVADARHGPIATAVLEQAHRAGASVIVVGSAGRSRSPSAMLGGISSALIRRSDLPVLVVRPGMTASPADEPILVGYDGSPAARQALATSADVLAGRAAIVAAFMPAVDDVAVLRSALPWPVAGAMQDGLARLDREEAEAPAERAVEGARAAAAVGFVPRPVGIPGIDASSEEEDEPFKRLLRAAAAEKAACIVVGHRPFATPLDSTAHGLIHHSDRPVLVVPGAP